MTDTYCEAGSGVSRKESRCLVHSHRSSVSRLSRSLGSVTDRLTVPDLVVSDERVEPLMREGVLQGVTRRRRFKGCTRTRATDPRSDDLVHRQ